jgi:hypothetical protein
LTNGSNALQSVNYFVRPIFVLGEVANGYRDVKQ